GLHTSGTSWYIMANSFQ
ncbi:hypothetical protein ABKN59_007188, partial [Abortiporus biennis]